MEVTLVMAVIVILVGITLPSLLAYARNAKQIERSRQEELVGKAIRQYYSYVGNYPNLTDLDQDDAEKDPLSAAQISELKDDLQAVTSARINIDDYKYSYNEHTGECSLELLS